MRFIPFGLFSKDGKAHPPVRASDYSNDRYDGVRCGYDSRDNPVIVMHSRRDDPMRWKVVYGYSTVFFSSFKEAMDFCNSRDVQMVVEPVERDHE